MMKNYTFTVSSKDAKQRLDRFLAAQLTDLSRSAIQKLIVSGDITLNGKRVKVGEPLRVQDTVHVNVPPPQGSEAVAEAMPLDILYEDADVIIINKPAGLVVHPAAGHATGTLVNALLHYDSSLSTVGGRDRPGIVHRLDKGTSGILIIARNEKSRLGLLKQFKERTVSKEYWALVHGILSPPEGRFESSLGRHPQHRKKFASTGRGKTAVTDYRIVKTFAGLFSEVRLHIHTGRTHQIRVHLSEAGHPIIGDKTYGGRRDLKKTLPAEVRDGIKALSRPALHAAVLGFKHPKTHQDLQFSAPLPADLKKILSVLEAL